MLAELWWRAVYSRPDDVVASVASATEDAALAAAAAEAREARTVAAEPAS